MVVVIVTVIVVVVSAAAAAAEEAKADHVVKRRDVAVVGVGAAVEQLQCQLDVSVLNGVVERSPVDAEPFVIHVATWSEWG